MPKPQNVLQYEFFHVGGSANSIEEVFAECAERTSENIELILHGQEPGIGIKTVLRIYDVDGKVTHLAQEAKRLEDKKDSLLFREGGIPVISVFIDWVRWAVISKKLEQIREELFSYATEYLNRSVREMISVAIEKDDHSFREIRDEELLDISQAIKHAHNFWLFVFEPNRLLADENKLVVSLF